MKILIITSGYVPVPNVLGGAVEDLLCQYLRRQKSDEIVVYSIFNKKLNKVKYGEYKNTEFRNIKRNIKAEMIRYKNAALRRINPQNVYPTFFDELVIEDLRQRKEFESYDLIILENNITIEEKLRQKTKSKIVLHLHNDYVNEKNKNSIKIISNCDEIWTVSNFINKQVAKVDSNIKIITLYNGIDVKEFTRIDNAAVRKLKKELNIKEKEMVYIYVGRLFKEKGVLELLDAFNTFAADKKNVKLIIVGEKKSKKIKDVLYYKKCLRKKTEKVCFLGNISRNQLKNVYRVANVQIIPTLVEEAFGLVLIEGIICGTVPIITDSGALPELTKGYARICKRKKLLHELVNNMEYYYKNPDNIIEAKNRLKGIVSEYTIEKYVATMKKLVHGNWRLDDEKNFNNRTDV